MGHVIITTAILVVCFLVNADFVGKTCSQHHWNIVVSIYFWFCLQSKVSRKGRWSLPRMFFVAFVQFVSKLFFPKMYWDFNGWACNPAGGPQDPQGCNYCNYAALPSDWQTCIAKNDTRTTNNSYMYMRNDGAENQTLPIIGHLPIPHNSY